MFLFSRVPHSNRQASALCRRQQFEAGQRGVCGRVSRRFKIDAVSLHSGLIASNFRAKLAPKTLADRFLVRGVFPVVDALVGKSLSQGATTSVYVALGTAPGGSYLEDSQITPRKGNPRAPLQTPKPWSCSGAQRWL